MELLHMLIKLGQHDFKPKPFGFFFIIHLYLATSKKIPDK
jgi:hypothetical protein